jgi:hypothetical protein
MTTVKYYTKALDNATDNRKQKRPARLGGCYQHKSGHGLLRFPRRILIRLWSGVNFAAPSRRTTQEIQLPGKCHVTLAGFVFSCFFVAFFPTSKALVAYYVAIRPKRKICTCFCATENFSRPGAPKSPCITMGFGNVGCYLCCFAFKGGAA